MKIVWQGLLKSLLAVAVLGMMIAALVSIDFNHNHGEESVAIDTNAAIIEMQDNLIEDLQFIFNESNAFNVAPAIPTVVYMTAKAVYGTGDPARWQYISSAEMLAHRMLQIMWLESRMDPEARGDNGRAFGLTQMWVTTAQLYESETNADDLLDPITHISLAFRHFVDLLDKNNGDDLLVYYAWNYGQRGMMEMIAGRRSMNQYAHNLLGVTEGE